MQRDCGRPPIPRKDPGIKWEEEPLLSNHPYVDKVFLSLISFNLEYSHQIESYSGFFDSEQFLCMIISFHATIEHVKPCHDISI